MYLFDSKAMVSMNINLPIYHVSWSFIAIQPFRNSEIAKDRAKIIQSR